MSAASPYRRRGAQHEAPAIPDSRGLVPLCPWSKCLRCGSARLVATPGAPTCCTDPMLLSVYTIAKP